MNQVDEAIELIRRQWDVQPAAGIVLGTGLGNIASHLSIETTIPYDRIPGFPTSTALAHAGRLVCGLLEDVPVVVMEGRCHLYEGYSRREIALPIQVFSRLGIQRLILSNASGGLNPRYASGDVVVIEDHLDWLWSRARPSRNGMRPEHARCRLPSPYSPALIELAMWTARQAPFAAHRGVYIANIGPCYETRAEYRFMRKLGDVVGMSTVPEAEAARDCGLEVLALSTVTNVALPDAAIRVDANEVVEAAARAEPKVREIVRQVVADLRNR